MEVLEWSHRYLPSPSDPSKQLVLSDEQARFVIAFYETEGAGYVYRRGALEAAKGWGKSPLGAVLALAEFCGPVAPATPWVQIAACSEDQAVSNVYALIWAMLSENEGKAARELGIDLGRGRLYLKSSPGAKLEAVSSSWGAREGQRLTFGLCDETHAWLKSNGGQRLARVLRRNAAKMDGRTLELANAPEIGEGSVAEQTEADHEAGAPGVLFHARRPSVEPSPDMDDETLRDLLSEVYEGAPWIDTARLLREVRDPAVPWPETLRFFYNTPSAGLSAAVEPLQWDSLARPQHTVPEGTRIALGFDGSLGRDATALVAVTIEDGHLFPIRIAERPRGADDVWRVDRADIEERMRWAFDSFDVTYLYADPWLWRDELTDWAQRYPDRVVEVPTNSVARMTAIVDRFRSSVAEGNITHSGDATLRAHVLSARLKRAGRADEGYPRYTLERAGPKRYIDACVAACLALEAKAATELPDPEPQILVSWA